MKIGVFDSGIGGLTVLHEALKVLPNEHYLYYADTAHVPYGTKPKEEVKRYVFEAVAFLVDQGCDAIVIACNTATSVAIDDLRATFHIPIIGMEPAVKPAVQASDHKRVLVFATELTLKEPKFHNLVAKVDNEGIVDYLSLQKLVTFAEQFEFNNEIIGRYLLDCLSEIEIANYRHIVLGCTHFIYFHRHLCRLFPNDVVILDGNAGTIRHLKKHLLNATINCSTRQIQYFNSGKPVPASIFEPYFNYLSGY